MTPKPALIAFGWNRWNDYWMPHQHYLSRLAARGWSIAYSSGNTFVWDLVPRLRQGPRRPFAGFRETSNLKVFEPGLLCPRWPSRPGFDRFARRNEVRQLKAAVDRRGRPLLALMTYPAFAPYLDELQDIPLVYFAIDAYGLMPGWTADDRQREARLVARADLVLTCAASMARHLPGEAAERARILRNGVDFAAYSAPESQLCPDDLAVVPEPRIGYTGSINQKVDFELIASLARRRPDWNWVLVGPVALANGNRSEDLRRNVEAYEACRARPNVHFLGTKPFHALPRYTANMNVNAMCYRTDRAGWWTAIDPMKTNEYLASGRPVVSADQINVRPFADCLAIAEGEDEWQAAIEAALSADRSAAVARGLERAKANDWSLLTDELEAMLLALARA